MDIYDFFKDGIVQDYPPSGYGNLPGVGLAVLERFGLIDGSSLTTSDLALLEEAFESADEDDLMAPLVKKPKVTGSDRAWLNDNHFDHSSNSYYWPSANTYPHVHLTTSGGELTYVGLTRGRSRGAIYDFFKNGRVKDSPPKGYKDLSAMGTEVLEHFKLIQPTLTTSGADLKTGVANPRVSYANKEWLRDYPFEHSGNSWYYPGVDDHPHIHLEIDTGYLVYVGVTPGGSHGSYYDFFKNGHVQDNPSSGYNGLSGVGLAVLKEFGLTASETVAESGESAGAESAGASYGRLLDRLDNYLKANGFRR